MNTNQGVIEIDLLSLMNEFKRHIALIIIVAILGAGFGFGLSKFIIKPTFESTSVVFVLSKETTLTSLADLQIGSQLTVDYMNMVTSTTVMLDVIDKLGLDLDDEKLAKKIKINNPQNSRLLRITVTDENPELAQRIAYETAKSSSTYIAQTMEMIPPKIIEKGKIPKNPSNPSVSKWTAIGGILGGLFVCALIAVISILNDTVVDEADVEKYLGGTVLASIPEREDVDKDAKIKEIDVANGTIRGKKIRKKKRA